MMWRLVPQVLVLACAFHYIAKAASPRPVAAEIVLPFQKPTSGLGLEEAFGSVRFEQPIGVLAAPGETNRLFIIERAGVIAVITNLARPNRSVFLDLRRDTVSQYEECGLLGVTFHPGFATNGFFYAYRTAYNLRLRNQLSRFRVSTQNANVASSEELVLFSEYNDCIHHNGGDLHFGPDGYLYVAIGEAARWGGTVSQYPMDIDKSFFGTMLRIDVDKRVGSLAPNPGTGITTNYSVPPDNPWVGATNFMAHPVDPREVRTELYAVGLRQPYRFYIDPITGEILLGDVGENRWEEINVIQKGKNYGYPTFEGHDRYYGSIPPETQNEGPLFFYGHGSAGTNVGSAIIGGLICRQINIPELEGAYVFGDFISGNIWKLNREGQQPKAEWIAREMGVSSFGRDPRDGALLVANVANGAIRRMVRTDPAESEVPTRLSETGVFSDLSSLTVNPGIEPFEINVPFWSDHATKKRWFGIARTNHTFGFSAEGNWTFPAGAVWVKHFELDLTRGDPSTRRRLETRLLIKSDAGVLGYTYRWGNSLEEATLVPSSGLEESFQINDNGLIRTQVWKYPGRGECQACHSPAGGFALGFNSAQLNRSVVRGGTNVNQLEWLARSGYLDVDTVSPGTMRQLAAANDLSQPIQHRVQSYLTANCVGCHQPGGTALRMRWDARITTPMWDAGIIDNYPLIAWKGDPNERIIRSRDSDNSLLYRRLERFDPFFIHMPPLASNELNVEGMSLLKTWIGGLPAPSSDFGDLGEIPLSGSVHQAPRSYFISGAGTGLDEHFSMSIGLTNSAQVIARIKSVPGELSGMAAGISIRAENTVGSPTTWLKCSPFAPNRMMVRSAKGVEPTVLVSTDPNGPKWLRFLREGNRVSGWEGESPTEWRLIGSAIVDLPLNIVANLTVASGDPWRYATVEFDQLQTMTLGLSASPSDPDAPVARDWNLEAQVETMQTLLKKVEFQADGRPLATVFEAPWRVVVTNLGVGDFAVKAVAFDDRGLSITSAPVYLNVEREPSLAKLVETTENLLGTWSGRFGSLAYAIPGLKTNFTGANGSLFINEATEEIFPDSTLGPGLADGKGGTIKSAWAGVGGLDIRYEPPSARPHRLTIYLADYENMADLRVSLIDLFTGSNLAAHRVHDAGTGRFLSWIVRGPILLRVQSLTDSPARVSGVFTDLIPAPKVELNLAARNILLPGGTMLSAKVDGGLQGVHAVRFFNGMTLLGEDHQSPYEFNWTNLLEGEHSILARAIGAYGLNGDSDRALLKCDLPEAKAVYLRTDTSTRGDWLKAYGQDGFAIPGLVTNLIGAFDYQSSGTVHVWSYATKTQSALEHFGSSQRYWGVQYASPLDVVLTSRDGRKRQVALYFTDSPFIQRKQLVKVLDAVTGATLDTRTLQAFSDGTYLVYDFTGAIHLKMEAVDGWEPVLGGVFLNGTMNPATRWRVSNFSPELAGSSGWSEDPDKDGRVNLLEYVAGSDPFSSNLSLIKSLEREGGWLKLNLDMGIPPEDAIIELEGSFDLHDWNLMHADLVPQGTGLAYRFQMEDSSPIFFRVRAELR